MTSSTALIYRERPCSVGQAAGTLIALHDAGGDVEQMQPLLAALDLPLRAVAPQAWRPLNPRGYGPGDGQSQRGFTWHLMQGEQPEPASFGDCLWQLEQFIFDAIEGGGAPVFLLGQGQGGALAATLACVMPDCLAGVAVVGGAPPRTHGFPLPSPDMGGLPVLFIHEAGTSAADAAAMFTGRGARAETEAAAGASRDPLAATEILRGWFAAQLAHARGSKA